MIDFVFFCCGKNIHCRSSVPALSLGAVKKKKTRQPVVPIPPRVFSRDNASVVYPTRSRQYVSLQGSLRL